MAEQRQPEISVSLTGEGPEVRPESFELKGKKEQVDSVLATWTEGGQGPSARFFTNRLNRTFFRVRTREGSVYEIAHELPENRKSAARWVLVQQLNPQPAEEQPPVAAKPKSKAAPKPAATRARTTAKKPAAKAASATKRRPTRKGATAKSR
jgi:hypothetical protein